MAINTPTVEHILAQAQELSSRDQVRLMERLFALLERNLDVSGSADSQEAKAKRMQEWHDTVERTYGALADDPIERPPQGEYEQRDEIL